MQATLTNRQQEMCCCGGKTLLQGVFSVLLTVAKVTCMAFAGDINLYTLVEFNFLLCKKQLVKCNSLFCIVLRSHIAFAVQSGAAHFTDGFNVVS